MAKDKLMHLGAGCAIAFASGRIWGPGLGLALACLAGLAKEAYDKLSGKGTVEALDFWATFAGGLIGAGIFLISGV